MKKLSCYSVKKFEKTLYRKLHKLDLAKNTKQFSDKKLFSGMFESLSLWPQLSRLYSLSFKNNDDLSITNFNLNDLLNKYLAPISLFSYTCSK